MSAYGRSEPVALYRAYNRLMEKEKERMTWVNDSTDFAHPENQVNFRSTQLLGYRSKIEKILYPNGVEEALAITHGFLVRNTLLAKKSTNLLKAEDIRLLDELTAETWGPVSLSSSLPTANFCSRNLHRKSVSI